MYRKSALEGNLPGSRDALSSPIDTIDKSKQRGHPSKDVIVKRIEKMDSNPVDKSINDPVDKKKKQVTIKNGNNQYNYLGRRTSRNVYRTAKLL